MKPERAKQIAVAKAAFQKLVDRLGSWEAAIKALEETRRQRQESKPPAPTDPR